MLNGRRAEREASFWQARYWSESSTILFLKITWHTLLFVKPFHATVIKSWQIKRQTSENNGLTLDLYHYPQFCFVLFLAGKLQGEGTQKWSVVCGVWQSNTPPQNKNDIIWNPRIGVSCLFIGGHGRSELWIRGSLERPLTEVDVGKSGQKSMEPSTRKSPEDAFAGRGPGNAAHRPRPPTSLVINPWNYLFALLNFSYVSKKRVGTEAESKSCVFSSAD